MPPPGTCSGFACCPRHTGRKTAQCLRSGGKRDVELYLSLKPNGLWAGSLPGHHLGSLDVAGSRYSGWSGRMLSTSSWGGVGGGLAHVPDREETSVVLLENVVLPTNPHGKTGQSRSFNSPCKQVGSFHVNLVLPFL